MITVVGLGFLPDSVTNRGMACIRGADKVVVRTGTTPACRGLGREFDTMDDLYEKAEDFDKLNAMIAERLLELNKTFPKLVYCVDGDGFKDSSVIELKKRTEVRIVAGPFDLNIEPATSCTYIGAYDIRDGFYPDPLMPICVYNIDDANIAGDVKLFLLRFYDATAQITLCDATHCRTIALEDLDRQKKYSCDTAVMAHGGNNSGFADLLRIMARLTAPNGCPWDKAQTHESIRINLLEEAYETVDAITNDNIDGMIEELGDVLLQVVFHCDIAFRHGEFTLEDVVKGLNDKLIGRHTHIFGSDKAEGADGALTVWERNKMKEKKQETFAAAVNDIPLSFPALLRAQKAVKRTQKGGWGQKTDDLRQKISKETGDLLCADNEDKATRALGKLLLYVVWAAQNANLNCEQILLDTVKKVQKVYEAFEKLVTEDGKDVNALTESEREIYCGEAIRAANVD